MTLTLENLIVLLVVALAVCALGRRLYKFFQQAGGGNSACGTSCGGCGTKSNRGPKEKPLIQLEMTSDRSS